jgi:hypothetical protein
MADLQSDAAATESVAGKALTDRIPLRLHTGCTDQAELPADLARLVDAWPKLPEHIRRAILTLADGCK